MNIALFQLNTCDLGFPPLLLGTLIPFLLGLLLGWLIWSKWRKMYDDMVSKYDKLTSEYNRVTAENEEWERKYDDISSQLRTAKMDINRLGHEIEEHKDSIKLQTNEIEQFKIHASAAAVSIAGLTDENDKLSKELTVASSSISANKNDGDQDELKSAKIKIATLESELKNLQSALVEKKNDVTEMAAKLSSASATPIVTTPTRKDDLTKVEGIGPKTKELFYNANINTFEELANSEVADLQDILTKAGSRYQLLDAGTWPRQARLAADGKWEELEKLQDYLDGGKEPTEKTLTEEDLVAAADIFGKKIKLNDLTLVEGIGPKIESLLNEAGITTWRKLADTQLPFIIEILENNSLGFHTPTTWPKQAEMAADGKWAALLKWQDELDGGK